MAFHLSDTALRLDIDDRAELQFIGDESRGAAAGADFDHHRVDVPTGNVQIGLPSRRLQPPANLRQHLLEFAVDVWAFEFLPLAHFGVRIAFDQDRQIRPRIRIDLVWQHDPRAQLRPILRRLKP